MTVDKTPLVANFAPRSTVGWRGGERVDIERFIGTARSLALRLQPVRVPSMRSVANPAEAFAEIGAHLVLDPSARTYLARPVVEYFDVSVFPALRRAPEKR